MESRAYREMDFLHQRMNDRDLSVSLGNPLKTRIQVLEGRQSVSLVSSLLILSPAVRVGMAIVTNVCMLEVVTSL